MQETGSCESKEYYILYTNGISVYPSFYVPRCKSKVIPLILGQN